ncbi:hypothetical protein H6G41_22850 [Tolypothrix sp. FACHB-123]|uniref:hypothetical protein n=1 Tax=Tolypothrix sp. FACHB-123 TaxID=2692868 RepID=UPI001687D457|nr:hypothetical protein [Tolypothrix sp. FACHB-123]MBD2357422.1 hypothetical protein [Tolypothrix sp. FACHB-123]
MEQISINLSIEEVNQILESLGQRPYVEVFQLISKIKIQAEAQVQANQMRKQAFDPMDLSANSAVIS